VLSIVIIGWLKEGKIPEAEQTSFKIWRIPATVAEMFKKSENRPKLGRPAKTKPKPTKKSANKSSKKGSSLDCEVSV
jgi:hypothetical protein